MKFKKIFLFLIFVFFTSNLIAQGNSTEELSLNLEKIRICYENLKNNYSTYTNNYHSLTNLTKKIDEENKKYEHITDQIKIIDTTFSYNINNKQKLDDSTIVRLYSELKKIKDLSYLIIDELAKNCEQSKAKFTNEYQAFTNFQAKARAEAYAPNRNKEKTFSPTDYQKYFILNKKNIEEWYNFLKNTDNFNSFNQAKKNLQNIDKSKNLISQFWIDITKKFNEQGIKFERDNIENAIINWNNKIDKENVKTIVKGEGIEEYSVTFFNHDDSILGSYTLKKGESIYKINKEPYKEGHCFGYWSISKEKKEKYIFGKERISEPVALFPIFDKVQVIINVSTNDIRNYDVNIGYKIQKPIISAIHGLKFTGFTLNDEVFNFDLPINRPVTIKAEWIPTYSILFYNENELFCEKIVKGNKIVESPAVTPEKQGYLFKYWVTSDDVEFKFNKPINTNISVYAFFEKIEEENKIISPKNICSIHNNTQLNASGLCFLCDKEKQEQDLSSLIKTKAEEIIKQIQMQLEIKKIVIIDGILLVIVLVLLLLVLLKKKIINKLHEKS